MLKICLYEVQLIVFGKMEQKLTGTGTTHFQPAPTPRVMVLSRILGYDCFQTVTKEEIITIDVRLFQKL